MPVRTCDHCNGEGHIWIETPDVGPPYLWSESKVVCEHCHGAGEVVMGVFAFDGERVRIKATGVVGTCNVFSDDTICVLRDDDVEFDVTSYEEIELCES